MTRFSTFYRFVWAPDQQVKYFFDFGSDIAELLENSSSQVPLMSKILGSQVPLMSKILGSQTPRCLIATRKIFSMPKTFQDRLARYSTSPIVLHSKKWYVELRGLTNEENKPLPQRLLYH